MFNWKEFFYYDKSERVAVILLLILVIIVGTIYVYIHQFSSVSLTYVEETTEIQEEFDLLEKEITRYDVIYDDSINSEEASANLTEKKSKKEKLTKLKEGQTIDLNSASVKTLQRIPSIGETFAIRIIEYRDQLGGFANLDQLREIKGVTMNKFSKILPYVVIKKKHKTININKAVLSHPYINEDQKIEIERFRKDKKVSSINDLENIPYFYKKDIEKLAPYICFD